MNDVKIGVFVIDSNLSVNGSSGGAQLEDASVSATVSSSSAYQRALTLVM